MALVTILQFAENLTDRQAAAAVRSRIDWKYLLGLDLDDPGFHDSVLSEFRGRLVEGEAEQLLLDVMLSHFMSTPALPTTLCKLSHYWASLGTCSECTALRSGRQDRQRTPGRVRAFESPRGYLTRPA